MYLMGQGHEHLGPGTSMSQRINWTTGQEIQDNPGMGCFGCHGVSGMGCSCHGVSGFGVPDGGSSAGNPDGGIIFQELNGSPCTGGLGLYDVSIAGLGGRRRGLGLFDSGFDPSTFGVAEWAAVVIGAYVVGSVIFTTGRGVRRVRAIPGERRKKKAARLREEASRLTRKK